jgi:hypothetical protein
MHGSPIFLDFIRKPQWLQSNAECSHIMHIHSIFGKKYTYLSNLKYDFIHIR